MAKKKKLTKKEKEFIIKNKKPLIIIASIALVVVVVVAIVFKDQIIDLYNQLTTEPTPTETHNITRAVSNLKITNDGKLSWDSVGSEATYKIEINEETIETSETNFDLSLYKSEINDGLIINIYAQLPNKNQSYKKSITLNYDSENEIYTFEYNYSYEGYYLGLDYKMSDLEIYDFLHELIDVVTAGNGSQNSSYGEVRYILEQSDINPNNEEYLWGIYDNADIPKSWGDGKVFEREHVWPNSRLGLKRVANSNRNIASDPHNLRAIIGSTNSRRSNRYFVEGSGIDGYIIESDKYYPGDEHIGDVARILLYMATRYRDILTLVETPGGTTYEPSGAQMGQLSILLEWHELDPVDEFEIRRNEIIYEHQGNRNPYIDHPELFERVYNELLNASLKSSAPLTSLEIVIQYLEIQNTSFMFERKELTFS